MSALPPLIPRISCVTLLSLDDGSRLYSKYYSPRFTAPAGPSSPETQALRTAFEKQLYKRTRGSKSDPGVTNVDGVTTVHRTLNDVKVFVAGPQVRKRETKTKERERRRKKRKEYETEEKG